MVKDKILPSIGLTRKQLKLVERKAIKAASKKKTVKAKAKIFSIVLEREVKKIKMKQFR